MSIVPATELPGTAATAPTSPAAVPPLRWVMVGYFFWVGIFLGALIMHSATTF